MDTPDYTGPLVNEGSKAAGWASEIRGRATPEFPAPPYPPRDVVDVPRLLRRMLVVGGPRYADDPQAAARLAAHPAFADWPLVVLTDEPDRAARSPMSFLWTTFTRFEPAADIHAAKRTLVRNHVAYDPPIFVDARLKPGFPAELFCDGTKRTARR